MKHYLLECRNYREQRKKLRREVETGKMQVERLLGDPKIVKHILEYIKTRDRQDESRVVRLGNEPSHIE